MREQEPTSYREVVLSIPPEACSPFEVLEDRAAYHRVLPAGFWRRTAAVFFDLMFTGILFLPLDLLGRAATMLGNNTWVGLIGAVAASLTQTVLSLFLQGMLVSRFGATPGKLLLGLSIVHGSLGVRLTFARSVFREVAKILSAVTLCIGYFMVAFRRDKRALHDLIVDSVVVYRPRDPLISFFGK